MRRAWPSRRLPPAVLRTSVRTGSAGTQPVQRAEGIVLRKIRIRRQQDGIGGGDRREWTSIAPRRILRGGVAKMASGRRRPEDPESQAPGPYAVARDCSAGPMLSIKCVDAIRKAARSSPNIPGGECQSRARKSHSSLGSEELTLVRECQVTGSTHRARERKCYRGHGARIDTGDRYRRLRVAAARSTLRWDVR